MDMFHTCTLCQGQLYTQLDRSYRFEGGESGATFSEGQSSLMSWGPIMLNKAKPFSKNSELFEKWASFLSAANYKVVYACAYEVNRCCRGDQKKITYRKLLN